MEQASVRRAGRGGGRVFLSVILIALCAPAAFAAEVLFPKALHLTRRIEDPFANEPIVVEEYCAGNRMITVRGDRVVIADYDRQEITEIDRAAATYSITRFDEIAKSIPQTAKAIRTNVALPAPRALGTHRAESGRNVERFEVSLDKTRIEVGIDRAVTLNPAALEVLIGAAYPYVRSPQHGVIAAAADSGLPAEQSVSIDAEGTVVTVRNVITRVSSDLVPAELTAIPAGAKRVESRFKALNQSIGELDRH